MANTITFDQYIITRHSIYGNVIINDSISMIENIYKKKEILTTKNIDQLLAKLTKGRTNSCIVKNVQTTSILTKLTEKHVLNNKQIDKLIDTLLLVDKTQYDWLDWKWIYNLQNQGVEIPKSQLAKLMTIGYKTDIKTLINSVMAVYDDLYMLCSHKTLTPSVLDTYLTIWKFVPDTICFNTIVTIHNTNKVYISDYIKIFVANGFKPCSETLSFLLSYSYYNINTFELLISKGAVLTIDHANKIYDDTFIKRHHHDFTNIIEFTKLLVDNNVLITVDLLKRDTIYSNITHVARKNAIHQLYDLFFKTLKLKPTPEICDMVCSNTDQISFEYLIDNNIFVVTSNSLRFACQHFNKHMVEKLVNMKIIPTSSCLLDIPVANYNDYFNKLFDSIIEILYGAGLNIDTEFLDIVISKKYSFDLTKFGLEYDTKIYYVFHKYNIEITKKSPYYTKFNTKILDFRLLFKTASLVTIQDYIINNNIVPDMFCYDNSFGNTKLQEWLETTYGYSPTPLTLYRIENNNKRMQMFSKYLTIIPKYNESDIINIYIDSTNKQPSKIMNVIHNDCDFENMEKSSSIDTSDNISDTEQPEPVKQTKKVIIKKPVVKKN